jgi:membrane protein YdbS with pleckstrin-like domain
MDPWLLIGGTTVFLVIAVIISVIFVVMRSGDTMTGPSVATVAMLVLSIIIIMAAFFCYFNGYFNQYKTNKEDLTIKYDYLEYNRPVNMINSVIVPAPAQALAPRR